MINENKDHWYDGWFYDIIIAPNQDRLFRQIKNLIEPNSKVIDVGCGTGRFSFFAADKCSSVLGIDLSKRNIDRANLIHLKNPNNKISFRHQRVNEIISGDQERFDYAVMTYVIHEVHENERAKLLTEISMIADKIIIGDYLVPKPAVAWSKFNDVVEFAAGRDHYRNYKSHLIGGGINGLAERMGFTIITEIKNNPSTSHIVVLGKLR
jgi:SAM-dependent methyltransferase